MLAERVELGSRSLFPALEADAYLGYAAIAPVSAPVARAVTRVLDDYARFGQIAFMEGLAQRERLRQQLASFIRAEPDDVALISGTTRGISDLALCMPWQTGDTVLLFDGEFPANISPWQSVAKLFGLKLRFLPRPDPKADDDALLAPLAAALHDGARLVAVSAVQFQTGLRMPLAMISALCHRHGAELAVDGIQACGLVPMDVGALGVDYLVCGAHKWLMGIQGAGFLYAKPACATALEPRTAGWLSHEEGTRFLVQGPGELRYDRPIKSGVQFMESGSSSGVGVAALEASLEPIRTLTPSAIFTHVSGYLDELEAGIIGRGLTSLRSSRAERRSGILSIVPPASTSATELMLGLRRRRVEVTTPDGLLRFAPHFPNARSEIPRVLAALDETLSELAR
jgi:selenocysteine lyase/cysteine desulfurase